MTELVEISIHLPSFFGGIVFGVCALIFIAAIAVG